MDNISAYLVSIIVNMVLLFVSTVIMIQHGNPFGEYTDERTLRQYTNTDIAKLLSGQVRRKSDLEKGT